MDNNGDLSIVQSAKCLDGSPATGASCGSQAGVWNYAQHFTYNAAGAVTAMQLGNGRWESTAFNSRLQPTQIALGVTPGATNLLKLDYEYGATAAVNNGNITKQTITVPTVGQTPGFTAVQDYSYDSLNRLKSAVENITPIGGSQSMLWQQTFEFDRYGNRNFDEANTTFTGFDKLCNNNTEICSDLRKILNPSINQSNNLLSTSDDYVFDSSGNTTEDAQGRTFVYDAENKQIEVLDSQQNVIGEYWYDGDGRRIKKHVPSTGEVTVFVYSAGGQLVAEYSTIVQTQLPKVSYTTADHLGSPRILTDENGATISRRDFHPFGEEILTTHRHPDHGYTPDDLRQKFTTYERDNETDLDLAQARYYKSQHGRFTSPDPVMLSPERMLNPQMINLYVYAVNNPFSYVDPDGEENVQLGEDSEKKIKSDLEEVNKKLKKDKKNEDLKAQKKALETSLNAVREGNRVVGAWLNALKDRGEDKGLQLSDFTLSTDPQKDLADAARAAGKSEATIANEQQYWQGGENGAVGTLIGGSIYILNNSNVYSASLAGGGQNDMVGIVGINDLSILGGSYLRHEKDHRDNPNVGASEYYAFSNQRDLLEKINNSKKSFKNQKFFKDISNGIQRKIAEAKSAEGIK